MRLRFAAALAAGTSFASCAHAPPAPPAEIIWRGGQDNGNTLSSENDCKLDVTMEVHGGVDSHLSIGAQNHSPQTLFIAPLLAKIELKGGSAQVPAWAAASGLYGIPAGGQIQHQFALPMEAHFESHNYLQITLPVKNEAGTVVCEIHTTLTQGVPLDREPRLSPHSSSTSSSDYTSFDLLAGAGLPWVRTSNLSSLGGAGPTFELMGTYFFSANSGLSLFLGTEGSSGKIGSADLQVPAGNLNGLTGELFLAFFALDYTYRAHLGRQWALSYSVGPGAYYFDLSGTNYDPTQCQYYGNCGSTTQDFGSAFRLMLSQQIAVDYRFAAPKGDRESETGVGLAFYDFWIPSGSWGPVPVSGNSFGGTVFFITGW